MAEEKIIIRFDAKGDKGLRAAVRKLDNDMRQLQGKQKRYNDETILGTKNNRLLSNSFATLRSKMLLVNFALAMGVRQLIGFTKEAAKVESMARAFTTLSGGAENSSIAMDRLQKATNGTMSQFDLFQQANNAMILGVSKNSEEMAEMFDIAQRLGRALGRDTRSSVESLITGIGRQSRLMLDNIGIIVKADEAYEAYADKLGITADKLSDADKKTAFLEATMASARQKIETLGDETLTTQDSYDKLSSSTSNATVSMGNFFSTIFNLPAVSEAAASALDNLSSKMNDVAFAQGVLNKETISAVSNEKTLIFTIKEVENQIHNLSRSVHKDWGESFGVAFGKRATSKQKENMKGLREELKLLEERLREINILTVDGNKPLIFAPLQIEDLKNGFEHLLPVIHNFETDYLSMAEKVGSTPKMSFDKITSSADLALETMNQFSSSMGDAIVNANSFEDAISATSVAFRKALTSMAAQMAARAALFALFAPMFKFSMAGIGKFALTGAVAHKGGLIKDDGRVQRFATGGSVRGGDNVPILAQGGEFVMQRSAVESIGIENLNRMNQGGGGSVTVNVSGNVMSQDYVEGELAEQIKEAIRRGNDFGVS